MSIEEKRRAAFEAWWSASGMTKFKETAEAAWNAALDSTGTQVSDLHQLMRSGIHHGEFRRGIAVALGEFEAAGLKVNP